MKRVLLFLALCSLPISHKLYADNGDKYLQTAVRPLTHATADSIVKLNVKVASQGIEKLSDKLYYYWEKNGAVHKNQGSFSGNILHGKYTVTNAKGMMVTEGYFSNGTKDGCWKKWDKNGAVTQTDVWKEGSLKKTERYDNSTLSEVIVYAKNGKPKKKFVYASGKKDGYAFNDGKWHAKRKLRLFAKKQKHTVTDSPIVSQAE